MNKVVLLIPHYNNMEGLKKSMQSISSSEELDVVIVDDGSLVEKIDEALINEIFTAKGQIYFLYLKTNKGIERALNFGLQYIVQKDHYDFVARLDCGDLCLNNRFEKQIKFMEQYPEIQLLGTNVEAWDVQGNYLYTLNMPNTHKVLKRKMYLNCMFIHPSVMIRIKTLIEVGFYPENYQSAEDYALFFKIIKRFQSANLPESLVAIEINPKGISSTSRKIQVKNRIRIIKENFYFGFYPIYGLLRSYILLYTPSSAIQELKKIVYHAR
jgi:glycosyltransferase involved in cell wall biosynthesis